MPPKPMEPREANSRPSRLSLIADLQEGLLEYQPLPSRFAEPRSTMDWDEEEGTAKTKVRTRVAFLRLQLTPNADCTLWTIPRLRKLVEKASRRTLLGRKSGRDSPLLSPTTSVARAASGMGSHVPLASPMGRFHRIESSATLHPSVGESPSAITSPTAAPPIPDNSQQAEATELVTSSIDETSSCSTTSHSATSPTIASPRTSRFSRQSESIRNLPASGASTPSLAGSAPSRPSYTSNAKPGETPTPTSEQTTPLLDPEDDPSWNAAVARVKLQMRKGQEKERRDRKAQAKAEIKAIRTALEPERKFRWGKSAISKLITRSSAYGWQLKGDPNNYTDEEWSFIIDALNKDDTTPLRNRLFEKIGTIGVHSSAVQKFVESHQHPIKPPARPAPIGLGIRQEDSESQQNPAPTLMTTTHSSSEDEVAMERQRELRAMPSLPDSLELSDTSSTRRRKSLEALTNGFGTTDFDPRMSRILSVDVKKYLKISPSAKADQEHDKTSKTSGLAVRKISDPAPQEISARELSALKTAAAVAGCYRNVREAENFQSIVEDQERRLAQFAESSKRQATAENAEQQRSITESDAFPKGVTEQRPSMIPKPKPSFQGLRLNSQIHAARSYESLIPRPIGDRPSSRLPFITPERKLTAIHPALRLVTSSAPGVASKSSTLTRLASLRKSQSAFGLGTGFAQINGSNHAVVPRRSAAIRDNCSHSPAPLDRIRAVEGLSTLGSLPPSPKSSISATEIIRPQPEHATFGPPPHDPSTAANNFFSGPGSFIDLNSDGVVERQRSLTASMLSTSSGENSAALDQDIASNNASSDVFGVDDTCTHTSPRADSATLPPLVPSRNPARLWMQPSASVPPQQISPFQRNQGSVDCVVEVRAKQNDAQVDTPTRPSKSKIAADRTIVAARAKALRQLSNEGNTYDNDTDHESDHDTDRDFDNERERPLSNLFSSREEWIRTGLSADTASSTRLAPSRLYIPPQMSNSTIARKPLAQQQGFPTSVPRHSPATASTQQRDFPVPALLSTSSGTLSLTPARTRMQSRIPETPPRQRPLHMDSNTTTHSMNERRAVTTPTTFTPGLSDLQNPIDNTTTTRRSIVRAPTTPHEHQERMRRDQERTMVTETIRLGQALNSPSLTSAASAPLTQCESPSPRPSRSNRADTGVSNNTSGSSSRSRPRIGYPFNTDPIEQYAFDRRDRKASSARTRLSAEFDSVHTMLDHMSPTASKQSPGSTRSSRSDTSIERDFIRHDLGLRPLRDCEAGEPRHPMHPYEWDTVKVMCRNIHNPGTVLPQPPDIPNGQHVHMSDYADAFFVGMPHTVTAMIGPRKCRTCPSYCCHYADLLAHADVPTTDIVVASSSRRVNEAVECLRSRKPNGMEEFETFLQCSFCQNEYCPKCILLCKESLCQQPICRWCRDATAYCDDHNIF